MAKAEAAKQSGWALLPERYRARRHPKWWQELLFIAVSYAVYSLIRNGAPTHSTAALHRAQDILDLERVLHINVELSLNKALAAHEIFAVPANYWYALAHFVFTIGVMVWMYHAHPLQYRAMRTALYATTSLALIGYWLYPLAPPRYLTGAVAGLPLPHGVHPVAFIDTLAQFGTWGNYEAGGLKEASNQFAAMPSMHVGWSIWVGLAVVMLARRRWVRWLGAIYPLITLYVIMATANHYVLDAVGGGLALAAGFGVQRLLGGNPAVDRDLLHHLTAPDEPPPAEIRAPDPGSPA